MVGEEQNKYVQTIITGGGWGQIILIKILGDEGLGRFHILFRWQNGVDGSAEPIQNT